MLAVAESKYFEDLQIQMKQPGVKARFVLADAEDMVAAPGSTQPRELPLRRGWGQRSVGSRGNDGGGADGSQRSSGAGASGSAGSSGSGSASQEAAAPLPLEWRLWRRKAELPVPAAAAGAQPGPAAGDGAGPPCGGGGGGGSGGGAGGGGGGGGGGGDGAAAELPQSPFSSILRKPKGPLATARSSNTTGGGGGSSSGSGGEGEARRQPAARACSCPDAAGAAGTAGNEPAAAGPLTTFAPASFDCVIDTFGLCSCDDPVQACGRGGGAKAGLRAPAACCAREDNAACEACHGARRFHAPARPPAAKPRFR
jgi:hypothetical protein